MMWPRLRGSLHQAQVLPRTPSPRSTEIREGYGHLDRQDLAEGSITNQLAGFSDVPPKALVVTYSHDHSLPVGCLKDAIAVGQRSGHRLFDQHMPTTFYGVQCF